jgi:hypothetical protein
VAVSLIIDRSAGAVPPSAADVRGWAAEQRVFISSVMGSLAKTRASCADAITEAGATPVWFEAFGGRDDDAEAAYLGEVASSTIYLGILGREYGRLLPSRFSATHVEYREAERLGLRMSVWVHRGEFVGDQQSFLEEVRLFHTTGSFDSDSDLASKLGRRLRELAAEEICPWVKLGDCVFRAHEVHDNGQKITLTASVHDQRVVGALEQLRPTAWTTRDTRLTYGSVSRAVTVQAVSARTTASRATTLEIVTTRDPNHERAGFTLNVSLNVDGNSYSAGEVTELLVRQALFGERIPRGVVSLGATVSDPLKEIPTDLPSDLHSAVSGLLITEMLVGSGRAERITGLRIGPRGPAGRPIRLTWLGRSDYGRSGGECGVEGVIDK